MSHDDSGKDVAKNGNDAIDGKDIKWMRKGNDIDKKPTECFT